MTTLAHETMRCPACSSEFPATVCASTSSFGPCDLDTRPAPPARDAFVYDVAVCPNCGLAWPTAESPEEVSPHGLRKFVASDEYRDQLTRERAADAPGFVCATMVLEHLGQRAAAGWMALKAAWSADDADRRDDARAALLTAGRLWLSARRVHDPFADDPGVEACVVADVFRRAGWFAMADYQAGLGWRTGPDADLDTLLRAQHRLATDQDDAAHTTDEAPSLSPDALLPDTAPSHEERAALREAMLDDTAAELPCNRCSSTARPVICKPRSGSADWWDDPNEYIGCAGCGAYLRATPSIYPAMWVAEKEV